MRRSCQSGIIPQVDSPIKLAIEQPIESMINLYSDTQTLPTESMFKAMRSAELGDDVLRADPTVNRFEEEVAELFGKEASLLVPTATMSNLICLILHGGPGSDVFLDPKAHSYLYEAGGMTSVAGCMPRFYDAPRGRPEPESFAAAIRPPDVHFPRPRLLWLENPHNSGGGTLLRPEVQARMVAIARRHDLAVHVDGSRILNAAVALGRPVREIVQDVDTVSFCLSKGLSCPLGALVIGPRAFIDEARRVRKRLGGGMRQAGIIAACGQVALRELAGRLADDHASARRLAEALVDVPGLRLDPTEVETNMVFVDTSGWSADCFEVTAALGEEGVLVSEMAATQIRLVTHRHFDAGEIPAVVEAFRRAAKRFV